MNTREYLLALLAEEAVEIAQAAHKCIRFTSEQGFDIKGMNNTCYLEKELSDLFAVVQMLNDTKFLDWRINNQEILDKEAKILGYMEHSRKLGVLSETQVGV